MESQIIQQLSFNLIFTTELHFFNAIHQLNPLQSKDYFLCRYIL